MTARSAEELAKEFSPEHPVHTRADWRFHVAEGATDSGYWQWLADRLEQIEIGSVLGCTEAVAALREAVATCAAHWDALRTLENCFDLDSHTDPDATSDAMVEQIKSLAVGVDADDTLGWIDESTLETFMENAGVSL